MPKGVYVRKDKDIVTCFWNKVRILDNGCWEWIGAKHSAGYGLFWYHGRARRSHRFLYEQLLDFVPEGLELDHLCRNTLCVNPSHLEAVTHAENCRRGEVGENTGKQQSAKTHCPQGHPYDSVNTYYTPDGRRDCRACRNERNKRWRLNHFD